MEVEFYGPVVRVLSAWSFAKKHIFVVVVCVCVRGVKTVSAMAESDPVFGSYDTGTV